jgi:protein-S-isoprenylcysteine O-methyltransferase Ste14
VALFEFFQAAARAWIVTTHIFKWIAHGFYMGMTAIGAVYMSLFVTVIMVVIVLAVWAVNVWFLLHEVYSGM